MYRPGVFSRISIDTKDRKRLKQSENLLPARDLQPILIFEFLYDWKTLSENQLEISMATKPIKM